jgi:MoxR-like ATPase
MENTFGSRVDLNNISNAAEKIKKEIGKYVIGQTQMTELLLIALLADGHVLLEGVPGVAKTLTAKLLAQTIHADFKRIQFTPDLMPSDIVGTAIFNNKTNEFEFRKGPLFSNVVLADEINRAPAKTQAALFEAMEERQITSDGTTYKLPPPFIVLATQKSN